MRLIKKTNSILGSNSGETMVEVIVAFTLLSIMLIVFSEGIAWATRTEFNAGKSRTSADVAMRALQEYIATSTVDESKYSNSITVSENNTQLQAGWRKHEYTVTVDGDVYLYYGYDLPQ